MTQFRGAILVLAGCIALFEAVRIHAGVRALWALGLGLLAIGVGIWRLTCKESPRRLH